MKRISVRAVAFKAGKIALIQRIRDGSEYWVFPGGGVESGESDQEALIREIREELGVEVEVVRFWKTLQVRDTEQRFYICIITGGEIGSGQGPEYVAEGYADRGRYIPHLVDIDQVSTLNVVPQEVKKELSTLKPGTLME